MSMRALVFSISHPRCAVVPGPECAQLSAPGFARAS